MEVEIAAVAFGSLAMTSACIVTKHRWRAWPALLVGEMAVLQKRKVGTARPTGSAWAKSPPYAAKNSAWANKLPILRAKRMVGTLQ